VRPHILATHKRRRLACLVMFLGVFTIVGASAYYSGGITYQGPSGVEYKARFGAGHLTVGLGRAETPPTTRAPGWRWRRPLRYGFQFDMPWRPYHIKSWDIDGVVIPLWYLPAITFGMLLYTHGVVRGARWITRGMCPHCGYDLAGLPKGAAMCPECGKSLLTTPLTASEAAPRSQPDTATPRS
jgi:hypothetical protein